MAASPVRFLGLSELNVWECVSTSRSAIRHDYHVVRADMSLVSRRRAGLRSRLAVLASRVLVVASVAVVAFSAECFISGHDLSGEGAEWRRRDCPVGPRPPPIGLQMSDGKSSSYTVVSAAELRRRALLAARDRLDRVLAAFGVLEVELSAAEATYGSLGVSTAVAKRVTSDDPGVVEQAAQRLEAELAAARSRVESAVVNARGERLATASAQLVASLASQPLADLSAPTKRHVAPPALQANIAKVHDLFASLPAAVPSDVLERCERMVSEVISSDSEARSDIVLASLRSEVQHARDVDAFVERNRVLIDVLYGQLDGLVGDPAAAMRGQLRGTPLDAPISAELTDQVASVRAAAVRKADQDFALTVTRDALGEQGYALGDDFVTLVATSEGALVPLDGSTQHGIRVRERAGQLLFNVVRFDESGETDPPRDGAAAVAFCEDFRDVVSYVTSRGLGLEDLQHFDAGSGHLEVRKQRSPFLDKAETLEDDHVVQRGRTI